MSAFPIVPQNSPVPLKPGIESAIWGNTATATATATGHRRISIEEYRHRLALKRPDPTPVLASQSSQTPLELSGIKRHRSGHQVRVRQHLGMLYQFASLSSGATRKVYLAEARLIKKQEYAYRQEKMKARQSIREENEFNGTSAFPIVPESNAPAPLMKAIESAIKKENLAADHRLISFEEYRQRILDPIPALVSQLAQNSCEPSESKRHRRGRQVRIRQQLGKIYHLAALSSGATKRAYLAEARLIKQQENAYREEKQRLRRAKKEKIGES